MTTLWIPSLRLKAEYEKLHGFHVSSISRERTRMTHQRFARKIPQILALLCLAGCATVEPPFLNPPLERAPRDKTDNTLQFTAEPGAQAGKEQTATAFYQTPKPPSAARNTAGSSPLPAPPLSTANGQETVTLNLDNLPLPQFINAVFGAILKLNVSMDPQVAQRNEMVSLRTGKPQNAEQIYSAARSVLRSYGLAVNEYNGLVRVVPDNAQTGALPEIRRGRAQPDVPGSLRPIFYLAELSHTNSGQAVSWLRTLFPNRLTVTDDNARNALMLAGQTDTVNAALEALQLLDQPRMRGNLSARILPVFWGAAEMAQRLVDMLQAEGYSAAINAGAQTPILVLPVAPINSIVVFADNRAILDHVLRWAEELDQSPPGRSGGYISYYVRNTDAAELAATLKEVMGEPASAPAAPATGAAPAARSSNANSRVVVNKAANSLIIKTTPTEYQQWYGLLQELDRPARTALIMATVAEIRLTDSEQFGFQWMLKQFESRGYLVNTGISARPGDSASVSGSAFRIALANLKGDPRVLLTALASSNKIRILSNPSVMARNGESATIQVGQEVPILTSQISNANTTTGTGATGTLQTIQYRSTGVILKVKPVIHAGGRIEIEVGQEVSAAQANETGVNSSPVILTRKLETKLSVSDGNTVLLGGLISEQTTKGHAGIPFLKDIPYIGAAFRSSMSENSERTELVILLTPYVIEDDFDARAVTDAFRNQFTWAHPVQPPMKSSGETPLAPQAHMPASVSQRPAPPAQPATAAENTAMPDDEKPVLTRGKNAASPPSRSRPYLIGEEIASPAAPPPVTANPNASVVPAQHFATEAITPASTQKKTGDAVVDSRHEAPVQKPKAASTGQPVSDDALRNELLQAIQGRK